MLKKFLNFTLYSLTALTACFFSLILVLQFLNPAFSNTNEPVVQEKVTFKKIFKDIFSNFKLILRDLKPEKAENITENNPSPENDVSAPPESFEGNLEGVTIPNNEVPPQGEDSSLQDLGDYGKPTVDVPPQESGVVGEPPVDVPPQESGVVGEPPVDVPPQESGVVGEPPVDVPPQESGVVGEPPVDVPPQESGVVGEPPVDVPPQESGVVGEPPVDVPPQESGVVGEPPIDMPLQEPQGNFSDNPEEELSSEEMLITDSYVVPFVYASNQRDPFNDPTYKRISGEVRGEPGELGEMKVIIPKTPPEMYNLQEIQLKGIIWNTENPKALFELPSGEGHYTLIKGDKIGRNGLIFEIREDEVVIVETFYKGENQDTTERIIKIKKMDRLKLNEGGK